MIEQTNLNKSSNLMADLKYSMSFTSGGLFFNESQDVAEIYFDYKNWEIVKEKVLEGNILQTRKMSSLKRSVREIIFRLEYLNEDQLALLLSGTALEKKQILWYAICQKHKFIKDFSVEVLREKFLHLNYKISYRDFDIFFNGKAEWHDELDGLTSTTVNKIRQVLFRMMREADLILPNESINSIHITQKLTNTFTTLKSSDLVIFPISDMEIERLLR